MIYRTTCYSVHNKLEVDITWVFLGQYSWNIQCHTFLYSCYHLHIESIKSVQPCFIYDSGRTDDAKPISPSSFGDEDNNGIPKAKLAKVIIHFIIQLLSNQLFYWKQWRLSAKRAISLFARACIFNIGFNQKY